MEFFLESWKERSEDQSPTESAKTTTRSPLPQKIVPENPLYRLLLIRYSKEVKLIPERRLFWFLKEGRSLDLEEPSERDLYVQQVLTRGKFEDVKFLLKSLRPDQLQESVSRIQRYLPRDVRRFWEDFLGTDQLPATGSP